MSTPERSKDAIGNASCRGHGRACARRDQCWSRRARPDAALPAGSPSNGVFPSRHVICLPPLRINWDHHGRTAMALRGKTAICVGLVLLFAVIERAPEAPAQAQKKGPAAPKTWEQVVDKAVEYLKIHQ